MDQQLDALFVHGKPVAVTEFGCCTYRGAGGILATAEKEALEAREFGKAHGVAWSFVSRGQLDDFAFFRGDLAEAEC